MIEQKRNASVEFEPLWYAFVTKPRHEKKVKYYMERSEITHFLPMRKSLNQWKDRRRWVEAPLFSCYIFVHTAYVKRYDILSIPSVVRLVSFNNQPTPVRAEEIQAIQQLLEARQDLQVLDGFLPGMAVRIDDGPLATMEGKLVEYRGSKWFLIQIESIGKSILVDIRENKVVKV